MIESPKQGSQLSRRDLITAPFRVFRPYTSEAGQGDLRAELRDNIVEKAGELLSLAAIMAVAYKGSQDQMITYTVDSESKLRDLQEFARMSESINDLASVMGNMGKITSTLNNAWLHAYHKPETRTTVSLVNECDVNNNCSLTTKIETTTVYVWRQPEALTARGIDYNLFDNWTGIMGDLGRRITDIQADSPLAYDLSNGGAKVYYPEEIQDTGEQLKLAVPAYFAVGSAFIFYEEGLKLLSNLGSDRPTFGGIDQLYIKRRTLLKFAASLGLAWQIRKLQRFFADENKNVLTDIQSYVAEVIRQMDVSPEENFRRFFGRTPDEIRVKLAEINTNSKDTLSVYDGSSDSEWPTVRSKFEAVIAESDRTLSAFDAYFTLDEVTGRRQIPADLTKVIKYLWATREILGYTGARSSEIKMRHVSNAALMALGLGVTALAGELVLFPLLDKAIYSEPHTHQPVNP